MLRLKWPVGVVNLLVFCDDCKLATVSWWQLLCGFLTGSPSCSSHRNPHFPRAPKALFIKVTYALTYHRDRLLSWWEMANRLGPQISGKNIPPFLFWAKWPLIKVAFSFFGFSWSSRQSDRALPAHWVPLQRIHKSCPFYGKIKIKKNAELLEGFLKQKLLLWVRNKTQILVCNETRNLRVIQPEATDPHNTVYFRDSTVNFNLRDTEKEQEKEVKKEKKRGGGWGTEVEERKMWEKRKVAGQGFLFLSLLTVGVDKQFRE